jgi:hypothetical protein
MSLPRANNVSDTVAVGNKFSLSLTTELTTRGQ